MSRKTIGVIAAAVTACVAIFAAGVADAASKKRASVKAAATKTAPAAASARMIGVNVVLKGDITADRVKALESYGRVRDLIEPIDALTMP